MEIISDTSSDFYSPPHSTSLHLEASMAAAFSRREEEVLYWASYGVEVWAPVLAPIHTFPTVLIPMDRPTAEACVRYGEALLASSAFVSGADQADLPPWDEEEALVDLERAVAAAMRDMVAAGLAPDGGFMVKCSDRSPKDAVTEHGPIFVAPSPVLLSLLFVLN